MFFDDVRVPGLLCSARENEGWRVAMTTLNNERGGVASAAPGGAPQDRRG